MICGCALNNIMTAKCFLPNIGVHLNWSIMRPTCMNTKQGYGKNSLNILARRIKV